jgi:hypothetical protein
MGIGRPTKPLDLTAEEREKLTMLARRPKSAQAMAMRAADRLENPRLHARRERTRLAVVHQIVHRLVPRMV